MTLLQFLRASTVRVQRESLVLMELAGSSHLSYLSSATSSETSIISAPVVGFVDTAINSAETVVYPTAMRRQSVVRTRRLATRLARSMSAAANSASYVLSPFLHCLLH